MIIISALLTTIYSLRLIFYLFIKPTESPVKLYWISNQQAALIYPIIFLIVFSIATGLFLSQLLTNPIALLLLPLFASPILLFKIRFKPLN
jgi:NADH:ubiquinone oxidoreductase subunit 5 (subunit L)/multisubunit Na+/H+ antiporter MnhA subunit